MNSFKTLGIILICFVLTSFTSDSLPKTFTDLLDRANMSFVKPIGLEETTPIENTEMNYEYALKYPKKRFEVRYAIRPLDNLLLEYEENEKNKESGAIYIHPNKLYSSLLQVTALNISGGQLSEVIEFDKEAVKQEFNADWGATTIVGVGEEFGQDYKYCMIIALHKDNVADAYFFYLFDTKKGFDDLIKPAFHSLKFK